MKRGRSDHEGLTERGRLYPSLKPNSPRHKKGNGSGRSAGKTIQSDNLVYMGKKT